MKAIGIINKYKHIDNVQLFTAMKKTNLSFCKFVYAAVKDRMNCIDDNRPFADPKSIPIFASSSILQALSLSQPPSIYDSNSRSLLYYESRVVNLKRAIVLRDNYELFWAPWVADGSFSYTSESVRRDWKAWFPAAHNSIYSKDGESINIIAQEEFAGLKSLLDGQYKFVIKNHADANNYWHWTFEWLPRLIGLKEWTKQNKPRKHIRIVNIGDPLSAFQAEWLQIVLGESVRVENYSTGILCDNLIWVCPPFPSHHDPETLFKLRQYILGANPNDVNRRALNGAKRIYIKRGNARNGRNIENERELLIMLRSIGFREVAMDGLSVIEQAEIFYNADFIVGPHGSAFVNMLFCREDCNVLELFGPGYFSAHDYSLAYGCGINWNYILGSADKISTMFHSNYIININDVYKKILDIIDYSAARTD